MKPYAKLKAIEKIMNDTFVEKVRLRICDIVKSDVQDGIVYSAVVYDRTCDTFFRMDRNTAGRYYVREDDFYRLYPHSAYEFAHAHCAAK